MKLLLSVSAVLSLLFPVLVTAEEMNAGFVQGIWFENESVFANTPVRIYVALRNNTDHDLTGTVRFEDNEKRIGVSYVSALPGRLIEAWIDWTPSYGEHILVASLSNTQIHPLGENAEMIEVVSARSEMNIFVDYDTDSDGIGNETDSDDDNDGASDADEVANGTDPLLANTVKEAGNENQSEKAKEAGENNDSTEPSEEFSEKPKEGLEKYLENQTAHNILRSVTGGINNAKDAIDEYRATRNDPMYSYLNNRDEIETSPPAELIVSESATDTEPSMATITRSRLPNAHTSYFEKVLAAGVALAGWFYSFILLAASLVLSHPALVQLALLFVILFILYAFARRFGKRPRAYD